MQSFYCPDCALNWTPAQAKKACPVCGGGTVRKQNDPDPETGPLWELVKVERVWAHTCNRFLAYLDRRDMAA